MKIQRAIISGGTGAIGTALTQFLVNQGIEVLVLTRKESNRNNRIIDHPLVRIKECDYDCLDDLENDTGKEWECFFHFAWGGASGNGRNDMFLQNNNVKVALLAVKMAHKFGCKKFLGAGSQAEYGRHSVKLTTVTPTFPETGYGYAKLCAGMMTRDYSHQLGMEHNWLRILSVYGPNDGENSMIAQAIESFRKGISPAFTKGEQIWDYVYSKDAAYAFYCVGKEGKDGKTYVLGSGQERPLADYLLEVRDIVAPGLELNFGERPYGENQVMHLAADNTELKDDTGYEPHYSFKEGIMDMFCRGKELCKDLKA